ncbi:meiotic recombination protein SPO11 [Dermacentor albipictus]|uniref:meiotic recombination protein SPO11 n=1 Tax=Dermacentor albipictus TaxID=60249 RepID=UPI0031FBFBE1
MSKYMSLQLARGALQPPSAPNVPDRYTIILKIEAIVLSVIRQIANDEPPCFVYDRRQDWDSVVYCHRRGLVRKDNSAKTVTSFGSASSIRKFALMLKVLSKIHYLLLTNTKSTKRQIFYEDVSLFGSQTIVDAIVEDIACMLQVPRRCLNILATSKGVFAGDIRFRDASGNLVDGSVAATLMPTDVSGISELASSASCILVVEKDASFQKILDDGFLNASCSSGRCVLVTGKGFPDVNTREFVRRLHVELQLPVYALVDADPYGIEILCVYAYGSLAMASETDSLAVPGIRWLGVHPSDIEKFRLRDCPPLSHGDKSKLRDLLSRPYVDANREWKKQLLLLDSMQRKAEIQSLCGIGQHFLTESYIPAKIRLGGWI